MSTLGTLLQEYLTIRRAMGFKLERDAKILEQFIDYLDARGQQTITTEHALAWARSPQSADSRWHAARLSMVRGFAVHVHAIDHAHQVPPRDLVLAHKSHRVVPFLYTDAEITALVQAAGRASPPLRAATYQCLIRVLAVTGMRIGEAIGLDRADFDVDAQVLTVREAKFGKSRQVPLHPTSAAGLVDYLRLRDQLAPRPRTDALLLSTNGHRLRYQRVWAIFHGLVDQAGLVPRSPGCTPRIHDLRHTFAVSTLLDWYRGDADVQAMMPRLSTYLGHTDPKHTYWYLSAAPQLLALAAERLDAHETGETR